jgi:hypothetical protein
MPSKRIQIRGLKVTAVVNPADLIGLVPPEPAPPGEPVLDLLIEGTNLVVRAQLSGRGARRAIKAIDAAGGAENVVAICQGSLRGPATPGGPLTLDGAGLNVQPRTPKPAAEGGSS